MLSAILGWLGVLGEVSCNGDVLEKVMGEAAGRGDLFTPRGPVGHVHVPPATITTIIVYHQTIPFIIQVILLLLQPIKSRLLSTCSNQWSSCRADISDAVPLTNTR